MKRNYEKMEFVKIVSQITDKCIRGKFINCTMEIKRKVSKCAKLFYLKKFALMASKIDCE